MIIPSSELFFHSTVRNLQQIVNCKQIIQINFGHCNVRFDSSIKSISYSNSINNDNNDDGDENIEEIVKF